MINVSFRIALVSFVAWLIGFALFGRGLIVNCAFVIALVFFVVGFISDMDNDTDNFEGYQK